MDDDHELPTADPNDAAGLYREAKELIARLREAERERDRFSAEAGRLRTELALLPGGEAALGELPPAPTDEERGERLRRAEAERDEYLELARRERAEFDNYRKRVERDRQHAKRESLAGFLKDFFGPLDDLDRAIVKSQEEQSPEILVEGMRLTRDNLWKALAAAGVRKINAMGKPFDPQFHEAMATVPAADVPAGTVVEILDNGYKLDDFVLRAARVVVAAEPAAE